MKRLIAISLLFAFPAWAGMPTFVANGAAVADAAAAGCTPTLTGLGTILADDILIAVACGEGDDDGVGIALTTANGFASVMAEVSGDSGAGGEADPEINCEVFWKRAVGGDSAPVFTDSGDHTSCQIHSFRGVKTTGDPWNVTSSGNDGNANDTSAVIPGATTTANDVLVVLIQGVSRNAADSSECGAVTNADLGSITERFDDSRTQGLGGGYCVITGTKATAGSYADSTLTIENTTFKAAFSIGLEGAAAAACTAGLNLPLLGVGGCP